MAKSATTIDDIPFDWIATDLREGNCIPFLGAGASSFPNDGNAKPPSARRLAMELAAESSILPIRSFSVDRPPTMRKRRRIFLRLNSIAKI
jgi:hypothetical protein